MVLIDYSKITKKNTKFKRQTNFYFFLLFSLNFGLNGVGGEKNWKNITTDQIEQQTLTHTNAY